MKKLILAVVFCMLAVTSFSQNNAIGIRAGSGAELQYERFFNSGNVLKVNGGLFDFDGSFFGTCIYNWEVCNWGNWTPNAGDWFLQAGVGGALGIFDNGTSSDFNVGVAGDVAFGIHFSGAPITLAIDYRPTLFILNDSWGDGFGSFGLSCVFRF
ncbi:MAG: hypothetical protein IIY05_05995 [Alistipes sp.]|nr:hypothetical protein [Alistipes sp.]